MQPRVPSAWLNPVWLLIAVVGVGIGTHLGTIGAPAIFDDELSIHKNPSITSLARIGEVLWPPTTGSGVSGRPWVNLSLALNYAWGGLDLRGYHLFNIVLHALVGGLLFAVVRRLLRRAVSEADAVRADMGACSIALIWVVHPLQTESVASVIQRTEILGGFFYLLTLWSFVRSVDAARPGRWQTGAVLACWAGMAAKEIVFTAPLVVLLIDRAMIAGSFRAAWRSRPWFYLGLASSWIPLAAIVYQMGGTRGQAAGFGAGGITWWSYFLRQWEAICTYLKLVVWPHPLVVDYGVDTVDSVGAVAPFGALLVALVAITLLGVVRNRLWALPAAAFFLILGPSSSVMPLAGQTAAEHRMYLPLAAVAILLVLGVGKMLGRRGWVLLPACVGALLLASVARNQTYSSSLALWRETVLFRPNNPRAHDNLANLLAGMPNRQDEALAHYGEALRLKPDSAEARNNLASLLVTMPSRREEAFGHYAEAVRLRPDYVEARNNLANLLAATPGRQGEALAQYAEVLRLKPELAEAHNNLANLLADLPERQREALAHYDAALRYRPDYAEAHNNAALLLATMPGRHGEALAHYREAVRLLPNSPVLRFNYARQLEVAGDRKAESEAQYLKVIALDPNHVAAREALARLRR